MRVARQLENRLLPTALVLLYHRVAEPPSDPQLLCVTPQHFAEHLEILRRSYHPIGLQQLTQALAQRQIPPKAVAVTFDDGYADNLYNGEPLLERYGIPATVFAASGYVGQESGFWWDQLERTLLHPGMLPEVLELTIDGKTHRWELGGDSLLTEEQYRTYRCWSVAEGSEPTRRHSLYRSLHELLRPLPETERSHAVSELLSWAGLQLTPQATHGILSPEEVARLVEGGLIEIGAHTVTHPMLAALGAPAQRREIEQSKIRLEEILGRPVTSFSYPYGSPSDYTAETVALVREAGLICACSNFTDVVRLRTDRFQLPRALVRDWDGDEFARRLEEWFRG